MCSTTADAHLFFPPGCCCLGLRAAICWSGAQNWENNDLQLISQILAFSSECRQADHVLLRSRAMVRSLTVNITWVFRNDHRAVKGHCLLLMLVNTDNICFYLHITNLFSLKLMDHMWHRIIPTNVAYFKIMNIL